MSEKIKIVLNNQAKYHFQHLLRSFKQAVTLAQGQQALQHEHVFGILDKMGYLTEEKTDKDYELVSTIIYMLEYPRGSSYITQRNLFQFIAILNDCRGNIDLHFAQPAALADNFVNKMQEPLIKVDIGRFNAQGKWVVSPQDEKQLKTIFSTLIYTRASRKGIQCSTKPVAQQIPTFQPKVCEKSAKLAQSRTKALGEDQTVFERLYQKSSLHSSKIEDVKRMEMQQEKQSCTFRPQINSSKKHERMNSLPINYGAYLMAKGRESDLKLMLKKQQYKARRDREAQAECSFRPDLSQSFTSLKNSHRRDSQPLVKDMEKSIERVRIARQERQGVLEANRRGYPQVQSWTQFLQHVRQSRCRRNEEEVSKSNQNPVILTISLKLFGSKKYMQVKEGDNIQEMSKRLCKTNKIKQESLPQIMKKIEETLALSDQVNITNGVVSQKRK